jgi:class 3 adenylate cyclase
MMTQGTHTFLFSDIEDSTSLLQRLGGERYAALLEREAQILIDACAGEGGQLVDREGDGCMFVFSSAAAAIVAGAGAQRALLNEAFPEPVRVRMGVHTGEATVVDGRYVGVAVHRAARICAAAAGGQVLVSRTTREIVANALPTGLELDELGRRKLKGLAGLERLFALHGEPPQLPRPTDAPPTVLDSMTPAPAVRVADADRQRVGDMLRTHCFEGRLTLDVFSARLDELYAARDEAELAAVLRELPVTAHPPRPGKRRSWLLTLFGSEQRQGPWRVPERMISFSLIGSPDLDFRRAIVTSEEVRITSIALIGSLTAIVPSRVEVDLGGFCLFGGNDFVTREDVQPAPGDRGSRFAASRSSAAQRSNTSGPNGSLPSAACPRPRRPDDSPPATKSRSWPPL